MSGSRSEPPRPVSSSASGSGSLTAYQISDSAAAIGIFRTRNIQMNVAASTRRIVPRLPRLNTPAPTWRRAARQAGAASSAVMRRNCSKRSSISSRLRRATRSVPNSSTLNEAITEP